MLNRNLFPPTERILIDIDGIITDVSSKLISLGFDKDKLLGYGLRTHFKSDKEMEEFFRRPNLYHNMRMIEDANVYISKLSEYFIITLITKRSPDLSVVTQRWLKENDIYFDEIMFVKNKRGILGFCAIDDNPENCVDFIDSGVPTILLNWHYNKYFKSNKIRRADNWKEIYDIIIQMVEELAKEKRKLT